MKLFVEHLSVIDSAYLDATHGIVGESWIVDVTLHGDLDSQSMVMDFSHVKKQLKAALDASIDHTLIVPVGVSGLRIDESADMLAIRYDFGLGEWLQHSSPPRAVTLVNAPVININTLQAWLEAHLMTVVPENVSRVEVALRHEDTAPSYYHYAHGLKKHDGNCQRIAHGHRSRLMIWEDSQRALELEKAWSANWDYAYIATREDMTGEDGPNSNFEYHGDQGRFTLSYPTKRVRIISHDSTVECIAQHIADTLHARAPDKRYKVRAYEGVHKGAVAEA
jgi:6-pyruvoyl-tetrahydropterin synthase